MPELHASLGTFTGSAKGVQPMTPPPSSSPPAGNVSERDEALAALLQCPQTGAHPVYVSRSEASFGHTRHARIDGVIDFVGFKPPPSGLSQESPFVSSVYEAHGRPALTALVTRQSLDQAIELALAFLNARSCHAVLDVACGTGNFTRAIAAQMDSPSITVGLDLSWAMLRNAERQREAIAVDNIHYVRGDAQKLPFADNCFDALHCAGAFHLIPDKQAALREFHRVLKPGGRIVLGTFIESRIGAVRRVQLRARRATGFAFVKHDRLLQQMARIGFAHREELIEGAAITLAAAKR